MINQKNDQQEEDDGDVDDDDFNDLDTFEVLFFCDLSYLCVLAKCKGTIQLSY